MASKLTAAQMADGIIETFAQILHDANGPESYPEQNWPNVPPHAQIYFRDLARRLATVQREALSNVVLELLDRQPGKMWRKPDVRVALGIAATAVRRGRNLTADEQMENLAREFEQPIAGDTEEEIAQGKRIAAQLRGRAALSGKPAEQGEG